MEQTTAPGIAHQTESARGALEDQNDQLKAVHGRYSLSFAIFLIMGICIGSGIFFKTDNILIATGGDVFLGALMFVIAATYIVFGGLTLSLYASRTAGAGGILNYASRFVSDGFGRFMGYFYTFVYMPAISAVIFWVAGVYACQALGLAATLENQMLIGLVCLIACCVLNVLSPIIAGKFQDMSTILKIVPLLTVGAIGMWLTITDSANTAGAISSAGAAAGAQTAGAAGAQSWAWLAAAAPVAYSFDGWPIATSIAPELKNSKRNLPIALVVAPLLILFLYLAYFVGISITLGPGEVMASGDESLGLFFAHTLGEGARTLPVVIAFLAIFGVGNGVTLGYTRMPQALAIEGKLPHASWLAQTDERFKSPLHSGLVALVCTLVWMAIHYVTQKSGFFVNGDVSEVTISLGMLFMVPILLSALVLRVHEGASVFLSVVAPILACIPCLLVVTSGLVSSTQQLVLSLICAAVVLVWGIKHAWDLCHAE
ncbi:MAG: APC family permease [Atopobiaceae bacterium]|jgi:APA family basic amino acid/polyamine antiporter